MSDLSKKVFSLTKKIGLNINYIKDFLDDNKIEYEVILKRDPVFTEPVEEGKESPEPTSFAEIYLFKIASKDEVICFSYVDNTSMFFPIEEKEFTENKKENK